MAEQKSARGAHPFTITARMEHKETQIDIQRSTGKDLYKPRKFYFVGPSGGGKTTLAGYFPTPFFIDFEEGVGSIPFPVDFVKVTDWGKIFDVFARIEQIPNETIVMNDLTTMATIFTREVASAIGHRAPELEDRGVAAEHMRSIVFNLFQKPFANKYIILIAQSEMIKTEQATSVLYQPRLPGTMPVELQPFCDEVYRVYQTVSGPPTSPVKKHFIQTVHDGMWSFQKTRKNLKPVEDVTGEENIKAFLKKVGVLE